MPQTRGVYCIYCKYYKFDYPSSEQTSKRWSRVIYIGTGWLHARLSYHLTHQKNNVLSDFLNRYHLAYRYAPIFDEDDIIDYPRAVEAGLLSCFKNKFGALPPANRREERVPDLGCEEFVLRESPNFSVLSCK